MANTKVLRFSFKKLFRVILVLICCPLVAFGTYKVFNFAVGKYEKSQEVLKEEIENKEKDLSTKVTKASLIMAGDALIHGAVYADAYKNGVYDFKTMLSLIKPIVSSHTLAFYNQETILGGTEIGLSTYPTFNSPYEVGDAFLDAGFNIVSLANNHTLDRGEKAIINSTDYWKKKNVLVHGSAKNAEDRSVYDIREVNNIKYTMLSYTTGTNGIIRKKDYFVNIYDKDVVKKDIEAVRDKVDVLMVSMHWGEEYYQGITSEQKEIATYLSSLDVDIIIGTHPHVIEPIEYIGDTLVVYSLGNFISAQVGVEKLSGLMVSLDIQKTVEKDKTEMVYGDPKAILIYTHSIRSVGRTNFKVYPYSELNDSILLGYKDYYNKYMNIVTSKSSRIQKVPLEG